MILTLGLTLSLLSHALACDTSDMVETFSKIEELEAPLTLLSSTLKVKDVTLHPEDSEEDSSGRCSAARVSQKGHIVSALHCFEDCLKESGALKEISTKLENNGTEIQVSYLSRSDQPFQWRSCKVNVEGYGTLNFKVSAFGDCSQDSLRDSLKQVKPRLKPEDRAKIIREICPTDNDFIILQSDKLNVDGVGCLVGSNSPALGKKVYGAGFPMATARRNNKNSDGESLYITSGKVIEQNYCDQAIHKTEIKPSPKVGGKGLEQVPFQMPAMEFPPATSLDYSAKAYEFKRIDFNNSFKIEINGLKLIQVTSDAVPGNSGGPLVESSGKILGIASVIYDADNSGSTFGGNVFHKCSGSVFYIPIKTIQEKIMRHMSSDQLHSLFDCNTQSK